MSPEMTIGKSMVGRVLEILYITSSSLLIDAAYPHPLESELVF